MRIIPSDGILTGTSGNKTFLALFSSENHNFSHYEAMKEKYNINLFFPTYLSNQKIQGMGTANKHFFMDGLIDSFSCKHADYF